MTRATECRLRAAQWAGIDTRVAAAVVFGSVATGRDGEFSDLDLVLVASPGRRDSLWQDRRRVAAIILGADVAWGHEPAWHREFKYQAWPPGFDVMVDLTFDEGVPELWRGLVDAREVLVDGGDVAEYLDDAVSDRCGPATHSVDHKGGRIVFDDAQRSHFDLFGFVVLRSLLEPREIEQLAGEVDSTLRDAFADAYASNTPHEVVAEGDVAAEGNFLPLMADRAPLSQALVVDDDRLRTVAEVLIGDFTVASPALATCLVSDTPWHDDGGLGQRWLRCNAYVQPAARSTGALRVVPGTQCCRSSLTNTRR